VTPARPWLACLLLALLPTLPVSAAKLAPARPLEGVVTHVTDGDSLWFTPAGQPAIEVRLRDIDAPELCQPWGDEARRALAELALGRPGQLTVSARDPYGRALGAVVVDEVDLGRRMVEEGNAWSTRSRWDQGPLVKQERMAQALHRGLHAVAGAVMPRDFRAAHGPCAQGERPVPAVAGASARAPAPVAAPVAADSAYRCDGRTRCSQMHSCAEAEYFLAHCPGVQMDGDHDGVPCEDQWCGRR
jgi:endonuclease YncB( thermonuclease family)